MQALLEFILKQIIPQESFSITTQEQPGETVLEVKVDQDKIGLVIGKGGAVIKAIRNVLRIKATLLQTHLTLNLIER